MVPLNIRGRLPDKRRVNLRDDDGGFSRSILLRRQFLCREQHSRSRSGMPERGPLAVAVKADE
jgi:hypothetical protein